MVHKDYGREGRDDKAEQHHCVETGIHRLGAFRKMAGKHSGLESVEKPLLGHAASGMAQRGREGRKMHRFRQGALR